MIQLVFWRQFLFAASTYEQKYYNDKSPEAISTPQQQTSE